MIKLNLLPPHMRESEVSLNRIFLLIGLGFFFIFVMSYGYGIYRIDFLQSELKRDAEAGDLLRQSMRRKMELDESVTVIDEKNKILVNLSGPNDSWYSILVHLSALVPPDVWLDEVHVNADHILIIKGSAENYQELARFIREFERDSLLGDTALRSSSMKKGNTADGEIVGFEISAQFRE